MLVAVRSDGWMGAPAAPPARTWRPCFDPRAPSNRPQLLRDRTGWPQGFAYVEMGNDTAAQAAMDGLNAQEGGAHIILVDRTNPRAKEAGPAMRDHAHDIRPRRFRGLWHAPARHAGRRNALDLHAPGPGADPEPRFNRAVPGPRHPGHADAS